MAFISQNLLLGDTRLQLGAEEITRPLQTGAQWTKIRIGVRMACLTGNSMTNGGTLLGGTLCAGVCAGSKGFSAVDCADAVGAWFGGVIPPYNSVQWTYNTPGYISAVSGLYAFRKSGSSIVSATALGGSAPMVIAWPLTNTVVSASYWDITRTTAATTTVAVFNPFSPSYITTNVTRTQHLSNMESETNLGAGGNTYGSISATVTTTNAAWDTVFLGWGRSSPVLEIHDLNVLRLY